MIIERSFEVSQLNGIKSKVTLEKHGASRCLFKVTSIGLL